MKKIFWHLSVILISMNANAGPVINAVEWYQPAELAGYTWLDYAAICNEEAGDGLCTGSLAGGEDLTGWTWANVQDVNSLFNAFIGTVAMGPGPTFYQELNTTWAPEFNSVFDVTDSSSFSTTVSGYTRSTHVDRPANSVYLGQLSNRTSPYNTDFANTGNSLPKDWANFQVGAWLYRPASVPTPQTSALLALALTMLILSTRRSAAKRERIMLKP